MPSLLHLVLPADDELVDQRVGPQHLPEIRAGRVPELRVVLLCLRFEGAHWDPPT